MLPFDYMSKYPQTFLAHLCKYENFNEADTRMNLYTPPWCCLLEAVLLGGILVQTL